MGWKMINGNRYYYTSRRVNGRVVSEYIGSGFLGGLAERSSQEERAERTTRRALVQAEQARILEEDRAIDGILQVAKTLTSAALIVSGWHKHKGQWRRRRD
jgi:hypothetical protein